MSSGRQVEREWLEEGEDVDCVATVSERPHYFHSHSCPNKANQRVGGHAVCGTHARVARRWQAEGRLDSMVASAWRKR